MNAIQIADSFDLFAVDHTPDGWPAVQQKQLTEAALMLRKQHEAMQIIVEALIGIKERIEEHPAYEALTIEEECEVGGDTAELSYLVRVANEALADTEELVK